MGKGSKKTARGDKVRAAKDSNVFRKVRGSLKSFKKLQRELRKQQKKKEEGK